jgi:hypothetical protein
LLNRLRQSIRNFFSDQGEGGRGQAMAEFAIAFPLQLFLTFGLLQLILIYVSTLLVNFAAFRACRAAVVAQKDEDPIAYARIAAQATLAPVAGSHLDDADKVSPLKVPGWGERLNRSDISGAKALVHAVGDPRGEDCTIVVEYDQELVFPIVDRIFALFFKEAAEAPEEMVFGTENVQFPQVGYGQRPAEYGQAGGGRIRKVGGAYHLLTIRECTMHRPEAAAQALLH